MNRRTWGGLLAALSLLTLVACGKRSADTSPAAGASAAAVEAHAVGDSDALTVLATSDLRDLEPLAPLIHQATGVKVAFKFGGTMESTEAVLSGNAKADAAWFANAKYLLSSPNGQAKVKLQEKIMLSPIAVGVSESDARKNGWDKPDLKLTWKDIAAAAKAGKLRLRSPTRPPPTRASWR